MDKTNEILDPELYEFVATKVRAFRKESKLTQEQLANLVGVERFTINKIERVVHRPPIDLLLRISKTLNKNLYDFLPTK